MLILGVMQCKLVNQHQRGARIQGARAYGVTRNFLDEEPSCVYQPRATERRSRELPFH